MSKKESVTIVWFRRDLRLDDNTALYYALQEKAPVLPLFLFDTNILDDLEEKKDARVQFIHQKVAEIKAELEEKDSSMLIKHATPEDAWKAVLEAYNVKAVYTNRDYEPYAKERDRNIENLLSKDDIPFYTFKDQVIFEKSEVLNESDEPYKVFTPYKDKWLAKYKRASVQPCDYSWRRFKFFTTKPLPMPSLSDMGFEESNVPIPEEKIKTGIIKTYDKTRDYPAQDGTSRIGIHLRHGTISIRQAVLQGVELNDVWLSELIWREFYMMILDHFPKVVDQSFKPKYDKLPWKNDRQEFQKWCDGLTGYPIVDAGMRQLNSIGYMHNRVRMITASFLSKHLLIDWRWGEAYFGSKLLDYELASNNGGWQWAAGTGTDAQPYFRIFNPWSQADKYDPEQNYIKEWVPEYDTKDYPDPMVDHKQARQRAIDTYKKAIS
jgi:deoxyribodipyrimidine photo-lyase